MTMQNNGILAANIGETIHSVEQRLANNKLIVLTEKPPYYLAMPYGILDTKKVKKLFIPSLLRLISSRSKRISTLFSIINNSVSRTHQLHLSLFVIIFFYTLTFSAQAQNISLLDSASLYLKNEQYQDALKKYSLWLKTNPKENDSLKIEAMMGKAQCFKAIGNNTQAVGILKQVINVSRKNNLKILHFKASIILADIYITINKLNLVADIFNKTSTSNMPDDLVFFYYHRKAYYFNQHAFYFHKPTELDSAIYYSKKAMNIATKNGYDIPRATVYNELGSIYEHQKKYDQALVMFTKAYKIWKDKKPQDYANAYKNKTHVFVAMQEYDSAIFHLQKLKPLIDTTKWYRIKNMVDQLLSKSYFAKGDSLRGYKFKSLGAYDYFEVLKLSYNKQLREVIADYELNIKNQQINTLNTKIEKDRLKKNQWMILSLGILAIALILISILLFIKKKNIRLKKLMNENEFLLGETNHRIKNNLQLVTALIERELNKNESNKELLQTMASKIESIAILHKQLYLSDEKSKIEMDVYFKNICISLEHIFEEQKIKVKSDFKKTMLATDKAVYCGLLLNELFINSLKHAFSKDKSNKEITVTLKQEENSLEIYYADNGKGLAKSKKLKLISLLIKQVGAKEKIKNENGFNFKLIIPI